MFSRRKGAGNFEEGSGSKRIQKGKAKVDQHPPKKPPKPIVPPNPDNFSLAEVSLLARIFSELKMEIFFNYNYKNLNNLIYKFGNNYIKNNFNIDFIFDLYPLNQTFEKLKKVVGYYEEIATLKNFYDYNERANIKNKRESIMQRFTQNAQTMSTNNFKYHFKELTQINLGYDNDVNSLLGRVRAELAQLNETQIGGIYYNCNNPTYYEKNMFILFNLFKFTQMLVQSFINEYYNDAAGYYNSLIRHFNASKEISIQSYLEVCNHELQGNVNVFKNSLDYLGFGQFENNLIANYSKENDVHHLNVMWLAYLKDVDPVHTQFGQSSHYGGNFGDQGGQSYVKWE